VIVMSPRPSNIDSSFSIELSRPREPDLVYTSDFQDTVRAIRSRIGGREQAKNITPQP